MQNSSKIQQLLRDFAAYLALERGLSTNTENSYCSDLSIFLNFLQKSGRDLALYTEQDVRDFITQKTSGGIEASTIKRYLSSIHAYGKFLRLEEIRDDDPLKEIESPKKPHSLPKTMSEEVVEAFLAAPDLNTYVGLRDKAMLELLYACGLRVSELCNLKLADLHLPEHFVLIQGKGDKQRIIPINLLAIEWLDKYIYGARQIKDPQMASPYVFLSGKDGKGPAPMTRIAFWYRIKVYAKNLGLEQLPSPHTFRHAFATHLLNHDADLRSLQMLLGHSNLTTTQIYTHVATARMHAVYEQAHPFA